MTKTNVALSLEHEPIEDVSDFSEKLTSIYFMLEQSTVHYTTPSNRLNTTSINAAAFLIPSHSEILYATYLILFSINSFSIKGIKQLFKHHYNWTLYHHILLTLSGLVWYFLVWVVRKCSLTNIFEQILHLNCFSRCTTLCCCR